MTDATAAAAAPSAAQKVSHRGRHPLDAPDTPGTPGITEDPDNPGRFAAVLDDRSAAEVLAVHLAAQAGDFLRGLPSVLQPPGGRLPAAPREAQPAGAAAAAAWQNGIDLHTLRRVGAALHTFESLLDPAWSRNLREELSRLGAMLGQEGAYGRRLTRLLAGLDSLTSTDPNPSAAGAPPAATVPRPRAAEGLLARHPGAPKARALLERQLTLGRSRAHTATLQELGSARFHALADRMTLLASDLPLRAGTRDAPAGDLLSCVAAEAVALVGAAQALPMERVSVAYNGDGLHYPGDDQPWRQLHGMVQRTRYALELCAPLLGRQTGPPLSALTGLSRILGRHRDAAEAAEAASLAALTPRITPATGYVLGVVHADQRLEVEAARHAFGMTWPDLYRSGWLTDAWLTTR